MRKRLLWELREIMVLPADLSQLEDHNDVIDAALCVLAGADFLRGQVYYPPDIGLARQESWIWVRTSNYQG